MAYEYTNVSAAPVAVANGFVTSVAMKNGVYTLAASAPTFGARHVTCTRTVVGGTDTPGTLTVVGTDMAGSPITEVLTPGAHSVLVTGAKFFRSITSITGAGWSTATGDDTIVVGWDAQNAIATGAGELGAIIINTTAAGAIVVADAKGTIATIPSNVAVGTVFEYEVAWTGYLRVEPAAASNITITHSGSVPSSYSMA